MRNQASALRSKDLLGIEPLTPEEITLILDTAEGSGSAPPALRSRKARR
ncbi:MAG: hypothetical protein ACYC9N_05255 [Thermoanaerobaculia bacterium]